MDRLLFITMIILLLFFMITPSIVYGANNPEDLIIRREDSENLNNYTINERITTNLRMYAIITIMGFLVCPLLLFIGIILNIRNKENSNSKKGIALIISAIILFIMCMIIKIILQVK